MNPLADPHTPSTVKDLRVQIDAVIKKIENEFAPSRELALVKTKLQEAKMWAGKELENLGSQLPAEFRDEAQVAPGSEPAPTPPATPEHIVTNPDEAKQPAPANEVVQAGTPAPAEPVAPTTPAGDKIDIPVQAEDEVVVEATPVEPVEPEAPATPAPAA
jgi:hypothetical protein